MSSGRPRRPRPVRITPGHLALAVLTAWILFAGCGGHATQSGSPTNGIPQASFDAQLNPTGSSFLLTPVPGSLPDRLHAEVELVGTNLRSEPATETVSLDVSIRNVSAVGLSNPAQVWLSNLAPAGIEVLNADYQDSPIREAADASTADPARFGYDYAPLIGVDGVLSPGETSGSKTWRFHVPSLGSFSFAAVATFGGLPDGPVLGGLVFEDLNGDGVRNPGEPPLSAGITLQRPDGTVAAAGTLDDGTYRFPVQDVGLHSLTLQPIGPDCPSCELVVTTPNPLRVVLLPDANNQPISYRQADFGARIIQLGEPLPVVLTDWRPEEIRQDHYMLRDIALDGDILTLRVGFSGCTPSHDFPLYMSGSFMESYPVQARLVLGHDDHGEECDAAFERTLHYNLTPVRAAYEQAYGQPGLVVLQLTDLQGNHHSLRYRWGQPASGNLLPNGSFERDGQPTLEGWEVLNPALTSLVPADLPEGGSWALQLTADWAPTTGVVRAPVVGITSGQAVRLSAWVRAEGDAGGGEIYLSSGPWTSETVVIEASEWTYADLIADPRINLGDTLWVVLSSLPTEIAPRRGLFDRVVLEILPPPIPRS